MNILSISLTSALLIAAVILLRSLFLNRLPERTFTVLWNVIALRLLIPFSIPIPISIFRAHDILPAGFAGTAANNARHEIWPAPMASAGQAPGSAAAQTGAAWGIWDAVNMIWLLGAAALLIYFAAAYIRNVRIFRQALPCGDRRLAEMLNSIPHTRPVQIKMTDRFSSPLTYGILHPVILWPREWEDESENNIRYALMHECIHIRYFDVLSKLVYAAALCLHWFNPLVWCLFFLAGRDMEIACDRKVLASLGAQKKADYAYALINMEERKSNGFSPCSFFCKKLMEERITAIMKFNRTSVMALILAFVLVCGTATVSAFAAPSAAAPAPGRIAPAASEEPTAAVKIDKRTPLLAASGKAADRGTVVIEGKPGDVFAVGDLIFEVISQNDAEAVTNATVTRASTVRWSTQLSGTSMSESFEVTSGYPYAKVWINNTNTSVSSGGIIVTITRSSPTGTMVNGSCVKIAANTAVRVYSTNPWLADIYYVNLTCGKSGLNGSAACRVASSLAELNV
jgi:beta-lactamase regulating signal transducer with metallopeptidase domain